VYIALASEYGKYTDDDIHVMWVLAQEIARHLSLFKGDLLMFEGSNPSGQGGTVQLNNGANAIRHRVSYYDIGLKIPLIERTHIHEAPPVEPVNMSGYSLPIDYRKNMRDLVPGIKRFKDVVGETYYGDDFQLATNRSAIPWFTQKSIAESLKKQGKPLTNTSKGEMEEDFTPWERADFLKRGYRWDVEMEKYMAPLALSSITKPLFVWPSKLPFTPEVHTSVLIGNAMREYFQHGREVFNEKVEGMLQLAEKSGARPFLLENQFDYDSYKNTYLRGCEQRYAEIKMAYLKRQATGSVPTEEL
jgi:hypothetical protein